MDRKNLHNIEELWMKYETDCMSKTERIAFLEQVLNGEESLEHLALLEMTGTVSETLNEAGTAKRMVEKPVQLPVYLEEEILEHILGEEYLYEESCVQTALEGLESTSRKKMRRHLQLLCYSAKITFAAACAIVALFFMPDAGELGRMNEYISLQRKSETMARHQAKRGNVWEEWQIDRESSKKNAREQYEKAQEKRESNVGAQSTSYVADAFQNLSKIIYHGGFSND